MKSRAWLAAAVLTLASACASSHGASSGAPTTPHAHATPPAPLDAAAIERIIGHAPELKNGIVKVTIGRDGAMHGVRVGGSMGLTTWAAFSGSDALAAIDGDFIMTAKEVQPVLRALRRAGLHVVALHNHMVGEEPVFYFTHFWGRGPAVELARGFRAVLDAQAALVPQMRRKEG